MQPLYFNPLVNDTNFIGTNPLATTGVPIKTTIYPYFNPSIYQSFTFSNFPIQTYYTTNLLASVTYNQPPVVGPLNSVVTGGHNDGVKAWSTMEFYSLLDVISTQFSTFETFYASYLHIQPVTYSVRFGTQLQPIVALTQGAIDTFNTYEFCFSQQFFYYSYIVATCVF